MGAFFTSPNHTSASGVGRIYNNRNNIILTNNNNNEITPRYEDLDLPPNYEENYDITFPPDYSIISDI